MYNMKDKINIEDIKKFISDWKIISARNLDIFIHKKNYTELFNNWDIEKFISDEWINWQIELLIKMFGNIYINSSELNLILQKIKNKHSDFKTPEVWQIIEGTKNTKKYTIYRFRYDIWNNIVYWKEGNKDMIFNEDNMNESSNRFLKHKFENVNSKIKFII